MSYENNSYECDCPDFDPEKNTSFEEIYSLFLNSIQDYSIKNLFVYDTEIAQEMTETFLLRAIPKFRNCEKDLKNINLQCKFFNVKLDLEEEVILSDLMVLSWMDRVVNDIVQMNLNLNDNDFKHYSEEKNLREKSMYADRIREKVSQEMTNYGLYRTPFSQWAAGNYGI